MCIGGTEGTDIQGVCVSGGLKVRIYRVCVYRGTEGTTIQGVCVSGGLKVRIHRVCVYREDCRYGYTGCVCIGGNEGTNQNRH